MVVILVALMAMMTWRSGDTGGDVTLVFVTPKQEETESGNLAYLSVSGERKGPLLPAIRAGICRG